MPDHESINPSFDFISHLFFWICIIGLFIVSYFDVLSWMFIRFTGKDSYYTHGFLVPFVSCYFIWLKRSALKKQNLSRSWLGLSLIIVALCFHLIGTILYIFSISGLSIFVFIFGLFLFLFGKDVLRIIFFPLIFLVFMFPVPEAFLSAISFPLKQLVAKVGVELVTFCGIPVLREGFNISIPAGELVVGNPCSGLRSIIAFLALGAVFAYISNMSIGKKLLVFFSAVPAALLSNIIRVPMLILVSHFWGISAASPDTIWHSGIGLIVFVIALTLMIFFSKIVRWKR